MITNIEDLLKKNGLFLNALSTLEKAVEEIGPISPAGGAGPGLYGGGSCGGGGNAFDKHLRTRQDLEASLIYAGRLLDDLRKKTAGWQ